MNMNNIKIPVELKKYIRKKIYLRVMAYVALTFLFAIIIVKWGNNLFSVPEKYIAFKYSCYAFFLILPVFITKIYIVFFDTNYIGVIKKIDIKTVVDSQSNIKPSRETLYTKNEIYLTIETNSGKVIRKKVYDVPTKSASNMEFYKLGDKVIHLHGTGVTIVLPSVSDTHYCCAMCGGVNGIDNTTCIHCELPLIKSI